MTRNIEFKGFEPHSSIKKLIGRLKTKLERSAGSFSSEWVRFRLMIEQNAARSLYNIALTLDLPGKTLAARNEQHDLEPAVRAAFAEIERQLEKYKASLRGEHWKRPKRREEIRELKKIGRPDYIS